MGVQPTEETHRHDSKGMTRIVVYGNECTRDLLTIAIYLVRLEIGDSIFFLKKGNTLYANIDLDLVSELLFHWKCGRLLLGRRSSGREELLEKNH